MRPRCGDCRVDEIATQAPQAPKRPVLICAGEPAVPDDIGDQDRDEFADLAHTLPSGLRDQHQKIAKS